MVAVIKTGTSIRKTLNYNEHKIKFDKAELIHSLNFAKDTECLGFTDKIKTFEKFTTLNQKTRRNSVHISLNFDPSEKLDKETLARIADRYMAGIGFADQPYLVYQHSDAGHPHIHIVTSNIRSDGSRITMQNIGRNLSEPARKEIEQEFNLVRAQKQQLKQVYHLKPLNAQKVEYGKSETKRAITNVLDVILPSYKYASLSELNAVLKLYNVFADRGRENSRTFKNNGLVYRALNNNGEKVGSPVKASDIYINPGLKFLEVKFKENQTLKEPHKLHLKNAIDLSFLKYKVRSVEQLARSLRTERIHLEVRKNDKGIIYGMTYVDHSTKCVFNGSDLGKSYSSNAIQERLNQNLLLYQAHTFQRTVGHELDVLHGEFFKELLHPEEELSISWELKQTIKRKRKKKQIIH